MYECRRDTSKRVLIILVDYNLSFFLVHVRSRTFLVNVDYLVLNSEVDRLVFQALNRVFSLVLETELGSFHVFQKGTESNFSFFLNELARDVYSTLDKMSQFTSIFI